MGCDVWWSALYARLLPNHCSTETLVWQYMVCAREILHIKKILKVQVTNSNILHSFIDNKIKIVIRFSYNIVNVAKSLASIYSAIHVSSSYYVQLSSMVFSLLFLLTNLTFPLMSSTRQLYNFLDVLVLFKESIVGFLCSTDVFLLSGMSSKFLVITYCYCSNDVYTFCFLADPIVCFKVNLMCDICNNVRW